ncbi:MAG: hypothetical protein HKN39_03485 [Flavobacteriales bacterium]|nr:hypothetical protein [Flavobacteriales bacterium]
MNNYKKIWSLIPLVIIVSYGLIPLIGDGGPENWFLGKRTILVFLMCGFIFISGIGYYVNRKKLFGKKLISTHIWTTFIGFAAILISILGYYYYDVSIFQNGLEAEHFHNQQTNFVILVFLAAALIVVGLCVYMINLVMSNFSEDIEE